MLFIVCVCSYFDGDLPEEQKRKIKSEEDDKELGLDQRKTALRSHG